MKAWDEKRRNLPSLEKKEGDTLEFLSSVPCRNGCVLPGG